MLNLKRDLGWIVVAAIGAYAIVRRLGQRLLRLLQLSPRGRRFDDLRAAEDNDRRSNVILLEVEFRLEQFHLEPRRPHLGPGQKINVLVRHAIAWRLKDVF